MTVDPWPSLAIALPPRDYWWPLMDLSLSEPELIFARVCGNKVVDGGKLRPWGERFTNVLRRSAAIAAAHVRTTQRVVLAVNYGTGLGRGLFVRYCVQLCGGGEFR